jgi:hypothetical protein
MHHEFHVSFYISDWDPVPRCEQGTNKQSHALHPYFGRWIKNWWARWYEQSYATVHEVQYRVQRSCYITWGTVICLQWARCSTVYSAHATVHEVQWCDCSESGTVPCTVLLLQCLILAIYFLSDGSVRKIWNCSLVPCPNRGTGSRSLYIICRPLRLKYTAFLHTNLTTAPPFRSLKSIDGTLGKI